VALAVVAAEMHQTQLEEQDLVIQVELRALIHQQMVGVMMADKDLGKALILDVEAAAEVLVQ
jgi:hypothetical protein